ncbi:MAG: TerC family protein [Rhizobiales bacterium]|nr:TerC family protein [Hyphomicrobiales bacterium]
MFDWLFTFEGWLSLATLTLLEIVLGIDNLVFLTVAAQKLPRQQRARAQRIGLLGALVLRIAMLAALVWLTKLTRPVVELAGFAFSWRDIILILGGLFLLYKGTLEIHHDLEGGPEEGGSRRAAASFAGVIALIMVIDFVFALDSIITAVGMTDLLAVMILANAIAIGLMMLAAKPIGGFIARHPTVKMLALAFILLIGVALVADGFQQHIPRQYIYFAIAFSMGVEALNLVARSKREKRGSGGT